MRKLKLGLIGLGIDNSRSPALHKNIGQLCGLDVTYDLINLESSSKQTFIEALSESKVRGYDAVNITRPFKENAAREASALIMGKKLVIDGDFAILDLPLSDDPEMDKLRYYERKGNKWNLVDEFTGRTIDSLDFCNLQQKCLKIKDECNNNNESKKHFQERLNKEIHELPIYPFV